MEKLEKHQESLVKRQAELQVSLAETNQVMEESRKAYLALGDVANREIWQNMIEKSGMITIQLQDTADEAGRVRVRLNELRNEQEKIQNRVAGGNSEGAIGGEQKKGENLKSSLQKELGNKLLKSGTEILEAGISSAMGSTVGNQVGSIVGGIVSGILTGSEFGPWGAAIGAVIGGITGIIDAGVQTFLQEDEAFKNAIKEFYTETIEKQTQSLQNGTVLAANRETDRVAFSHLLGGEEKAAEYLEKVHILADTTPFRYEELAALSKILAPGFKEDTEQMGGLLEAIGNAKFALQLDENGTNTLAATLNQMAITDKATFEALGLIQGYGIDVYKALEAGTKDGEGNQHSAEEWMALTAAGKVSGDDVVQALVDYLNDSSNGFAGAAKRQNETYAGLTSIVEGRWNDIDAAMGEGYTEKRKEGLAAEVDWLGENSENMEYIYNQIGQYQAELENEKQRLYLETMEAAAAEARAQGLIGAEAGEFLAKAEMEARAKYLTSDGYQRFEESQKNIVEAARESALIEDAWRSFGYEMALEFEKGMLSALSARRISDNLEAHREIYGDPIFLPGDEFAGGRERMADSGQKFSIAERNIIEAENVVPNAWGLDRVPYDGYRAILHEGEQVLTAREARERRQGEAVAVNFAGANFSVREEADIDRIARAIVEQISRAAMLAGA